MRGFTLVELLVTMSLLLILTGAGAFISKEAIKKQHVEQSAEKLITALKQARNNAQAGKKNAAACGTDPLDGWEVEVTSNGYKIRVKCGVALDEREERYSATQVVNSSTPTVMFQPLGKPPTYIGTIRVGWGATGTLFRNVIISANGSVQ